MGFWCRLFSSHELPAAHWDSCIGVVFRQLLLKKSTLFKSTSSYHSKGQTNLKWFFQDDVTSKKWNEQIWLYYLLTCFRSFFGRKWRHQKNILKLTAFLLVDIQNWIDPYILTWQNDRLPLKLLELLLGSSPF